MLVVLNSLQKDLLQSMMNCLQLTKCSLYIYKNISRTFNKQKNMTKKRWKIEEETRFEFDSLKASFPFLVERWFFLDAGTNAAMPLPGLEEHFSEKRLHRSIYGWKSVRFSPRPLITRKILSQCFVARSNRIHV